MPVETVWIEQLGSWLPGRVLWEYLDIGRPRALVRYELPGGQVVRRLHWRDELRMPCVILEFQLQQADLDDATADLEVVTG